MSYEKESVPKRYYHPLQVLGLMNGFIKLNFEVPQTNSLYSSDCLYPINAKVNSNMLNNTIDETYRMKPPESIANNLKNLSLTTHGNKENVYDKQSYSSNPATYNLKTYSKPSYSGNNNNVEKTEEKKRSLSPNSELKKKFNMMCRLAASDNKSSVPTFLQTKKNDLTDSTNQYENENLEDRFHSNQEQEQKRQMIIVNNNNAQMSTSRTSISENQTPIMNDLSHKSECPICFKFYPTPVIEFHASECSI